MQTYIYIFVRKDLPHAQRVVQASHACVEVMNKIKEEIHPHIVVFGSSNEKKLKEVIKYLAEVNIKCEYFIEPDIGGQITAVATFPLKGEEREHLRKYCLL